MSRYKYVNGKITRNGVRVRGNAWIENVTEYPAEHEELMKDFVLLLNFASLLRRDPDFLDRIGKHEQIRELVQELS